MLKLLNRRHNQKQQSVQTAIYRAMLRREAEAGGRLFGALHEGTRREFFCLDEHTWVWHEEWSDKNGQFQHRTTLYDVRPSGVLKAQDGQSYQRLTRSEAKNLLEAVRLYKTHVLEPLYGHI